MNLENLPEAMRIVAKALNKASKLLEGETKKKSSPSSVGDVLVSIRDFSQKMKASPQRHLQLIGMWAEITKPELSTREQWKAFTQRHLKDASVLSKFSDSQIKEGFDKMAKAKIDKPTMGTIIKFLT